MTQYFFHIRDGDTLVPDEEGCELPDLEAVKVEATKSACDLFKQAAHGRIFISATPHIEVRDAAGSQVLTQPIHHSWWQRLLAAVARNTS